MLSAFFPKRFLGNDKVKETIRETRSKMQKYNGWVGQLPLGKSCSIWLYMDPNIDKDPRHDPKSINGTYVFVFSNTWNI